MWHQQLIGGVSNMANLQAGQVLIQNDATGRQTIVSEAVYSKSIANKISPFHGWSVVPQIEEEAEVAVKPARKSKKQVEA